MDPSSQGESPCKVRAAFGCGEAKMMLFVSAMIIRR
jgi:hypothetical protein